LHNRRSENEISVEPSSNLSDAESKEAYLMLLGPSDSGKTTFVTQLKILYGSGFSEQEVEDTKKFIYKQFFMDIVEIIAGCECPFPEEYRERYKQVYQFAKEYIFGRSFSPELRDSIQRFVEDEYTEMTLNALKATTLSESTR
jgi:guanine nucleotide-binding protein subunit alpha